MLKSISQPLRRSFLICSTKNNFQTRNFSILSNQIKNKTSFNQNNNYKMKNKIKQFSSSKVNQTDKKDDTSVMDTIMKNEPEFLQWFVQIHVPSIAESIGNPDDDPNFDGDKFVKDSFELWTSLGKPIVDSPDVPELK
mmetsp:Transcript_8067/g.13928  ORF Transcript_8067/g.13928 Transcript_8067/m.13928 type:complete len:138 (+) Transcript_8067:33-446(+)